MLYGRYSLTPTISAYVELFMFNFCVLAFECNAPIPMDIMPLVWLSISVCTAYATPVQVKICIKIVAPITLASLIVCLHHISTLFNSSQSSLSLFQNLLAKKLIVASTSSLARFGMNSDFALTK